MTTYLNIMMIHSKKKIRVYECSLVSMWAYTDEILTTS